MTCLHMGATPSLLSASVPAHASCRSHYRGRAGCSAGAGRTVEPQGVHVVLLRQRQDVLQRARHHDGLVRIGVEREAGEGAAGLHAERAGVRVYFASDFDESVYAFVSETRIQN